MAKDAHRILYLDDFHASDPLFLQSLGQALARWRRKPAPIVVHGSAEIAERWLEARGILKQREQGIVPVGNSEEHRLVERAGRHLNQHIAAIFNETAVPTVAVFGTQRRALVVENGRISARNGEWIVSLANQGVVPVLAAFAREETTGKTGEVAVWDAVEAIADLVDRHPTEVVFFSKTNLPGIMEAGEPLDEVDITHPKLASVLPDRHGLERILAANLSVLLTNSTRLADPAGPVGTRVQLEER